MRPDLFLQFAGALAAFFIKVAAAYFLCLLLTRLLSGPRQRFAIWLSFMLGSLAYWMYLGTFLLPGDGASVTAGHAAEQQIPFLARQFFLPAGLQLLATIAGKLLAAAYFAAVLVLLALAISKRLRLRSFLREADGPSTDLQDLFGEMRRDFGIRRCELLVHPRISSPATVYWWRPRILLPRTCEELGAGAVMADIFCHELAHVARRDYFWAYLNELVCGILFFHPAVWLARRKMRIQREMACDLAVVAGRPEHRADYAYTLTKVARLCLPGKYPIIGIDFAASASLLASRISAILDQPQETSWLEKTTRSVAGLGLVGVYGLLCLTFAVTIEFAHAVKAPQTAARLQSGARIAHSGRTGRTRRAFVSGREESLITESPAYRWQASPGSSSSSSYYGSASSTASQSNAPIEAGSDNGPRWTGQQRPTFRSIDATLRSIIAIAATVGASSGGSDKNDRGNKRQDKSPFPAPTP
jgi:beta-lactamase regulating signal transducer with metallopeptidase domain